MSEGTESKQRLQYAAGLCASLPMVYYGILLGWPSPAIPYLLSKNDHLTLTEEQCSWVVAMFPLGATPGCFLAQYLSDRIGRKYTILSLVIPCLIGAALTIAAKASYVLYISRFMNSIGIAMSIVVVSMYVGEISEKHIRGGLGSSLMVMTNLGSLIIYAIGPYVSYPTLNWICMSVPIVAFLACVWIPESPYYYMMKGQKEKSTETIMYLRELETVKTVEIELSLMQKQVEMNMKKKTSMIELLKKKEYKKAVIVLLGLKVLQQMTGSIVIQSYLQSILSDMNMKITSALASVIYGFIQLIAGMFAAILVDKMGRKPLLLISSMGVGISLTLVGVYFILSDFKYNVDDISWLPLISIILFNILYSFGIGNLPYVLQSEIFPTNVKSAASAIMSIIGSLMAFAIAKLYYPITNSWGKYTIFWIFAALSYVGVIFIWFYVPETKGKTLEEIQLKLNKVKRAEREEFI